MAALRPVRRLGLSDADADWLLQHNVRTCKVRGADSVLLRPWEASRRVRARSCRFGAKAAARAAHISLRQRRSYPMKDLLCVPEIDFIDTLGLCGARVRRMVQDAATAASPTATTVWCC